MSAYRFCRTDDIDLLVDALNRCWAPHFPDEPPVTAASFKRSIRDLQVWCSSCMVAFSGSDPIGVLIGGKRPSATLIHKIAVHPDHLRQGHGRHMLTSLGSKLAILGPPRIVAEVPEALAAGVRAVHRKRICRGSGCFAQDYVLRRSDRATSMLEQIGGGFVIPVTVDDLTANDLLGKADAQVCWERSVETLTARKNDIAGLAVATDEQIEAYILYIEGGEIVALRSFIEDDGARLGQLLSRIGTGAVRLPKVHPAEISNELLERLGFRIVGVHRFYAGKARSN